MVMGNGGERQKGRKRKKQMREELTQATSGTPTRPKRQRKNRLWAKFYVAGAASVLLMLPMHLWRFDAKLIAPSTGIESHLTGFRMRKNSSVTEGDTTSTTTSRNNPAIPPYQHSSLCRSCIRASTGKFLSCRRKMDQIIQRNKTISQREAQMRVATENQQECGQCHPDACPNGTKYWRYDRTAPKISLAVSHFLPSIPSSWRFPPSHPNITEYLIHEWNDRQTAQVLFEFNPTLVALTPKMREELDIVGEQIPTYLASFRVSSEGSCFPKDLYGQIDPLQVKLMRSRQNYVGFALLKADLTMIPGSDIVVDLESEMLLRQPPNRDVGKQFVDFRLFAFNDVIYLNVNGPPVSLVPIRISTPAKPYQPVPLTIDMIEKGGIDGIKLPNLFGDGLQVTLLHDFNTITDNRGKNYALFRAPRLGDDELLAEMQPFRRHIVHRIWPEKLELFNDSVHSDKSMFKSMGRLGRIRRRVIREDANESVSDYVPRPSFSNVDELWFRTDIFSGPHGGACCIRLDSRFAKGSISSGDELLVGLGHTKVEWRPWRKKASPEQLLDLPTHQYLSFFYAFESKPPYHLRARSGLFCLPFASDAEDEADRYSSMIRKLKLNLKRQEFDCPEISFASGMTEKAGDESAVIVSYGISDCASRMVEVDKLEVSRLLFTNLD